MAAAAARHIWATPRDWEVHRHLITQLYIDEERPLKDVMVIMKMAHDFHATEKMYKLRIRAWGLSKNLTSRDVPEMLQETLSSSQEPNRRFVLTIRGRQIEHTKVDRYLKRTAARRGNVATNTNLATTQQLHPALGDHMTMSLPRRMVCPSSLRDLSPPDSFRLPEHIVYLSEQFIQGYYDRAVPLQSEREKSTCIATLAWYMHFQEVLLELLDEGFFRKAFIMLDRACESLKELLQNPNPISFLCVFCATRKLPPPIGLQFLSFAATLVAVVLPVLHPIRLMLQKLKEVGDLDALGEAVIIMLSPYFKNEKIWQTSLYENEPIWISDISNFQLGMVYAGLLEAEVFRRRLKKYIAQLEESGTIEMIIKLKLIECDIHTSKGEKEVAEKMITSAGQTIIKLPHPSLDVLDDYLLSRFELYYDFRSMSENTEAAEKILWIRIKGYGPSDDYAFEWASRLHYYYRASERLDLANSLAKLIEADDLSSWKCPIPDHLLQIPQLCS